MPTPIPFPALGASASVRTYGGRLNDWGYDILLLDDGGTLIVGQVDNTGPSHRITPGKARLIRTDAEGDVIWQKDYGGEVDAMFYCPIQTGDDEYVILGQIAASYTRDEEDIYLVKIDGEGNEIWSHTYGGRGMDIGRMVRQTADGGFILVGDRADEFPSRDLYQSNLVLIKTDAEGNEVWTRTYGDKILYLGWGVAQTPDGGYVVVGWEAKTIPDRDVLAIKTDEVGKVEWTRTWDLDPGDRDGGFDMILTADGTVVIACIRSMDSGSRGAVLIKVDLEGNEVWVKDVDAGGEGNEFWDIMEDTDGGYVMAGARFLSPINWATGEAIREGLIIKTDPDGEVLWQYAFSSSEYESTLLSSAVVLPGHGYIFVGAATPSGEKFSDMLWLKLTPNTAAGSSPAPSTASPADAPPLGSGMIAFSSRRDGTNGTDIYVMNADGTDQRQLTNNPGDDLASDWSPDGQKLAFHSNRDGHFEIYVMLADGSAQQRLTFGTADNMWPTWSPDGEKIAFHSRRDGHFEIYVINADGTGLQRLTNTGADSCDPDWSPDGAQIAFDSKRDGNLEIYVVNADGSNVRRLTTNPVMDRDPAWSPDGKRIAFMSGAPGLYLMPAPGPQAQVDADGGNVTSLPIGSGDGWSPTWSPDGKQIAFYSYRPGPYSDGKPNAIYVVGIDGSNLRQLTELTTRSWHPVWRP